MSESTPWQRIFEPPPEPAPEDLLALAALVNERLRSEHARGGHKLYQLDPAKPLRFLYFNYPGYVGLTDGDIHYTWQIQPGPEDQWMERGTAVIGWPARQPTAARMVTHLVAFERELLRRNEEVKAKRGDG